MQEDIGLPTSQRKPPDFDSSPELFSRISLKTARSRTDYILDQNRLITEEVLPYLLYSLAYSQELRPTERESIVLAFQKDWTGISHTIRKEVIEFTNSALKHGYIYTAEAAGIIRPLFCCLSDADQHYITELSDGNEFAPNGRMTEHKLSRLREVVQSLSKQKSIEPFRGFLHMGEVVQALGLPDSKPLIGFFSRTCPAPSSMLSIYTGAREPEDVFCALWALKRFPGDIVSTAGIDSLMRTTLSDDYGRWKSRCSFDRDPSLFGLYASGINKRDALERKLDNIQEYFYALGMNSLDKPTIQSILQEAEERFDN